MGNDSGLIELAKDSMTYDAHRVLANRRAWLITDGKTGMDVQVLGSVKEGENIAHVVYRLSRNIGDTVATKIAITTVERDGETWKAQLNADLENVARAISVRLQRP